MELIEAAFMFHGHRCPAMPLGFRAGQAAMEALGVKRAKNKELMILAETGNDHAMGCFLDGVMAATGCTYGKSNIKKLYYNKLAFTLIETGTGRSVRVSVKPDFLDKAFESPFIKERMRGVQPQDIPQEIAEPQIEKILTMPQEAFLEIGDEKVVEVEMPKGSFDAWRCDACGEMTFINKLRKTPDGDLVCIPCSGE